MGSILSCLCAILTLIDGVNGNDQDVRPEMVDPDLLQVQLPDKVTYTLIVVLISYLLKMIFDVIYRLRKMECRWGSLCFCRSQFKEDEHEELESPTCPACSPTVHVNITGDSQVGLTERRARLNNIIIDADK